MNLTFFHDLNLTNLYPTLHKKTRNVNFTAAICMYLGNLMLTGLVAHVPVQEVQQLLGTAERSRTRMGQDVCGATQVSINSKGSDEFADIRTP